MSVKEKIAAMNKMNAEKRARAEAERQKQREEEDNKRPKTKLKRLYQENKLAAFRSLLAQLSKSGKDSAICALLHEQSESDDDMALVESLIDALDDPSQYSSHERDLMNSAKYKLLQLVLRRKLKHDATWIVETAVKRNLSIQQMEAIVDAMDGTYSPTNGSPLYFAVAAINVSLVRWLLEDKHVSVSSSPGSRFGSDLPPNAPIAVCIEMLKEWHRDFGSGAVEELGVEEKQQCTDLCEILRLLVAFGADPFKNYTISRKYGHQSGSPRYSTTHNVCLFMESSGLESVEQALVNGFRGRIERTARQITSAQTEMDADICRLIATFLNSEFYEQLRWKQMQQQSVQTLAKTMPSSILANVSEMIDSEVAKDEPIPTTTMKYNKSRRWRLPVDGYQARNDQPKRF